MLPLSNSKSLQIAYRSWPIILWDLWRHKSFFLSGVIFCAFRDCVSSPAQPPLSFFPDWSWVSETIYAFLLFPPSVRWKAYQTCQEQRDPQRISLSWLGPKRVPIFKLRISGFRTDHPPLSLCKDSMNQPKFKLTHDWWCLGSIICTCYTVWDETIKYVTKFRSIYIYKKRKRTKIDKLEAK